VFIVAPTPLPLNVFVESFIYVRTDRPLWFLC